MDDTLTIYAVRNAEGEWLRSSGYRKLWVKNVQDAKLYTKIGQARGRVTFWANHAPDKDPPVIVAFTVSDVKVLEEADRVAAAKLRKATRQAEDEKREATRRLHAAQESVRRAEAEIEAIRANLAK